MQAEIDVGRVVAGKYELVRLIGSGAMGQVWLATHTSLGGELAIKLVEPSDDQEDEKAAGRFQLEAQISAKLSRKTRHIVSVSDHGEEDGLAYLVMELLEGESLDARIRRAGPLALPEATGFVMQMARALGQAHGEGIFHRDLKPANVFLTKDEDGRMLVKLLDFGIARSTKPSTTRSPFATGKDMVLGTPSYMSPEQARGLDTLDHRCDLWALSVVTFEMLTGVIPWEGTSVEDIFLAICTHRAIPIRSLRPELPPEIEAVQARAFAPKLDDRFSSAAELAEAFGKLVDPVAVDEAMGGPARPLTPSGRRLPAASDPDASGAMAMGAPPEVHAQPLGASDIRGALGTNAGLPRKTSSGWLLGGVAALVTMGIIFFALRSLTQPEAGPGAITGTTPAPILSATPSDRASIPAPGDPVPHVEPVESAASVTAIPAPRVGTRPTGGTTKPSKTTKTSPVTASPAPEVTPVVIAPARTAPSATPAPATTRKPLDRGEVF